MVRIQKPYPLLCLPFILEKSPGGGENSMKASELNHCYLIDKLLSPKKLDVKYRPVPPTEGGRRKYG